MLVTIPSGTPPRGLLRRSRARAADTSRPPSRARRRLRAPCARQEFPSFASCSARPAARISPMPRARSPLQVPVWNQSSTSIVPRPDRADMLGGHARHHFLQQPMPAFAKLPHVFRFRKRKVTPVVHVERRWLCPIRSQIAEYADEKPGALALGPLMTRSSELLP